LVKGCVYLTRVFLPELKDNDLCIVQLQTIQLNGAFIISVIATFIEMVFTLWEKV
jgi:hypothetical protein